MARSEVPRKAAALAVDLVLPLVVLGFAWGSPRAFYAHPVRAIAVVLFVLPTLAMVFFTSGFAAHARRSRERWGYLVALNVVANLSLIVAVYLEGHGIGILPGGEVLRWTGLALLAAGTILRAGTMLELGSRFTLTVSAQEHHRLETTGFYSRVRHPSYLGLVLISLGVAGVFRSGFWLALLPLMLAGMILRIRTEERFLLEQLGEEYRAYMARTARLLPGVY